MISLQSTGPVPNVAILLEVTEGILFEVEETTKTKHLMDNISTGFYPGIDKNKLFFWRCIEFVLQIVI